MGISYNLPKVSTEGLLLYVDAANPKSYPSVGSTTWFDLSGNNRDLTLYNSVGYASANKGVLDFDRAVSNYAKTTNNGLGTGSRIPHSLEMWVKFDIITGTRWWLSVIGQYSTGAHHWIGRSSTGDFGAWSAACQRTVNLIGTGIWLHIVMTYDGTRLKDYVNNVYGDSCVGDAFNFTNTEFNIGFPTGSDAYFDGQIGMCRLYNRALSAEEVEYNFNTFRGRYGV